MTNPSAAACPIFQGFTVEEYEQVLELLEQESYATGDVIIDEGKSKQDLWIVVQGSCEVVKMNKSKSQKQLATIEAGAVFGEMSFFQKAPHSATVRALTAVKVMRLTRENFELLQTQLPRGGLQNRRERAGGHGPAASAAWTTGSATSSNGPEGADHREEWHDFRAKLYADWQF